MNGKLDCQLVIEMIRITWDKQMATYPSQPDGPPKGGPADSYIIYIHMMNIHKFLYTPRYSYIFLHTCVFLYIPIYS